MDIPPSINLTAKQAKPLQQMLKQPHYIVLHVIDQAGSLSLLPMPYPNPTPAATSNTANAHIVASIAPPLYPLLTPRVHV
jgi:hypothetical protein